jgi:hypothetical protein
MNRSTPVTREPVWFALSVDAKPSRSGCRPALLVWSPRGAIDNDSGELRNGVSLAVGVDGEGRGRVGHGQVRSFVTMPFAYSISG